MGFCIMWSVFLTAAFQSLRQGAFPSSQQLLQHLLRELPSLKPPEGHMQTLSTPVPTSVASVSHCHGVHISSH